MERESVSVDLLYHPVWLKERWGLEFFPFVEWNVIQICSPGGMGALRWSQHVQMPCAERYSGTKKTGPEAQENNAQTWDYCIWADRVDKGFEDGHKELCMTHAEVLICWWAYCTAVWKQGVVPSRWWVQKSLRYPPPRCGWLFLLLNDAEIFHRHLTGFHYGRLWCCHGQWGGCYCCLPGSP